MRLTAILAGLFFGVVIIFLGGARANAQAPRQIALAGSTNYGLTALEYATEQRTEVQKPKEHVVVSGETLTTIAKQHNTTWQRIYAKNPQIANPDIIDQGQVIIIPLAEEQLAERAQPQAPQPVQAAVKATKAVAKKPRTAVAKPAARGSSGGNTYTAGYCTWYAKSRRPDLPNNLGNADTWVARASAQGIPTGSAPRAGAIGQRGMHVVYVESVNGDGTVSISEMNHAGWNVVSSRTVPASYFQYIY
jgi:peptidoglycan DL-endopeptidase CwlO